jgi:hypothetical protein
VFQVGSDSYRKPWMRIHPLSTASNHTDLWRRAAGRNPCSWCGFAQLALEGLQIDVIVS